MDENRTQADHVYQQWTDLRGVENHFNEIEAGIRQMASAWLLAALGAIAFILQGDTASNWIVSPPEMLVSIIALMGIAGISVLWVQDQLVYHRLLNSAFLMGLKLEYDHPSLPPLRSIMMIYSDKAGMARLSRLYYLGPLMLLVLICWVASGFYFGSHWLLALIFDGAAIYAVAWVWHRGATMEHYHERARGFDEGFVRFLQGKEFEDRLAAYSDATRADAPQPHHDRGGA